MNDISRAIIEEALNVAFQTNEGVTDYVITINGAVAQLVDYSANKVIESFPVEQIEEKLASYGLAPERNILEIAQARRRGVVPTRAIRPVLPRSSGIRPTLDIPSLPGRVPEQAITTQTLPGETPFELIFRRIVTEIARKKNKNVTFESNKHSYSAIHLRNSNKLDFFKGELGVNQSTTVKDAYLLRFDFVVRVNTLLISLIDQDLAQLPQSLDIQNNNPYNIVFAGNYYATDQISAIASLLSAISLGKISIVRVNQKVFEDSLSKVKYSLGDIIQVGPIRRNIDGSVQTGVQDLFALLVSPGIIFNYTALTPFLTGLFSFSEAFVIAPGSELTGEVEVNSQAIPYNFFQSNLFSNIINNNGVPPVTIEMHFHTLRIF